MSVQNWEHFFKPEVRSSGRTLFSQGKVSIAQPSDTEVVVHIRVSSPLKVSLKSKSVSSSTVFVDCNCPAGKKGLFCKHIWAALLATEEKNPDFFESKTEIEKTDSVSKPSEKKPPTEQSEARVAAQAAFKEKQDLYRKIQYQKQKLRLQEYKLKKNQPQEIEFPREVEKALFFFSQNGFELRTSLDKESISSAKKSLARVFHPDFGGSHEEILELNKNAEILNAFTKN
jgi:hypothetical protein